MSAPLLVTKIFESPFDDEGVLYGDWKKSVAIWEATTIRWRLNIVNRQESGVCYLFLERPCLGVSKKYDIFPFYYDWKVSIATGKSNWNCFDHYTIGNWKFFGHYKGGQPNFFSCSSLWCWKFFSHYKGQPKWDKVWQSKIFSHYPNITIFWMAIELFQLPLKGGCYMFLECSHWKCSRGFQKTSSITPFSSK